MNVYKHTQYPFMLFWYFEHGVEARVMRVLFFVRMCKLVELKNMEDMGEDGCGRVKVVTRVFARL
jgi:hypothetical protein